MGGAIIEYRNVDRHWNFGVHNDCENPNVHISAAGYVHVKVNTVL